MRIDEKKISIILENRTGLIKYCSILSKLTASELSSVLTNIAIENGYITSRAVPPGTAISAWIKRNEAPEWACRAAFDMLQVLEWEPVSELDRILYENYLNLNQKN